MSTNPPKAPVKLILVVLVFLGSVLAVSLSYGNEDPSSLPYVGRVFVVSFCLTILLVYNPSQSTSDSISDAGEVIANLLLSLLFGWAIGTSANLEPTKQDLAMAGMLGLVFFSVTLIRRSTGIASRLSADMNSALGGMRNLADDMKGVYHAQELARLVTALAENLQVKTIELQSSKDENIRRKAINGFEAASAGIRQWINEATRLSKAPSAQDAWWTAMRLYHQEEVYDVAGRGMATTVRNYAMMLIGFLRTFSEQILKNASESKPARKLVLVNVTTFAPKDLLNFPGRFNGRNRFYYEPQFFGTYRRMLSLLTQNNDCIEVRRICLGHDGSNWNASAIQTGLDGHYKVAIDLISECLIPIPGEVVIPGQEVQLKGGGYDGIVLKVPEDEPKAARTLLSSSKYRMMPRICSGLARDYNNHSADANSDGGNKTRQGFKLYYDSVRHKRNSQLEDHVGDIPSRWCAVALLRCSEELRAATRDASDELASILVKSDNLPMVSVWTRIDWNVQCIDCVTSAVRETVCDNVRRIAQCMTEVVDNASESNLSLEDPEGKRVERALARLLRDQRDIMNALIEQDKKKLVLASFDLAEAAQDLDVILRQASPGKELPLSESGVPIGPMENWIYQFLVYIDAIRWVLDERLDKRLPLMLDVFMRDYLGGYGGDVTDVEKRLRDTFRLIPQSRDSYVGRLQMGERSLPAEFLLIGEVASEISGDLVFEHAHWHAAMVTNISEPFFTCRIQFLFERGNGEPTNRLRPKDLGDWVRQAWREPLTNEVNKELVHLIGYFLRQSSSGK